MRQASDLYLGRLNMKLFFFHCVLISHFRRICFNLIVPFQPFKHCVLTISTYDNDENRQISARNYWDKFWLGLRRHTSKSTSSFHEFRWIYVKVSEYFRVWRRDEAKRWQFHRLKALVDGFLWIFRRFSLIDFKMAAEDEDFFSLRRNEGTIFFSNSFNDNCWAKRKLKTIVVCRVGCLP